MSKITLFVIVSMLQIPLQANAQTTTEESERLQQLEQRVKELEQQAKAEPASPSLQSSLQDSRLSSTVHYVRP
ncbi:hypothetical protein L5M43_10160 [Shewanella sp. SW36]|uniref:hypothetical protein n=1 Tax=unclassified Shewanella TaxID=196818 RepID=UPI0021DA31A2|nr:MULTISPECIES: hypothetical protein [unclassified Shewanella]MCU7975626.1 hypothetical protein [Shewanella sp. SW36]MCU7991015.1 hypothetical protein [Shewanella sp. SW1]MCU8051575.1 hypothetical protein [Shewanella sp. SM43]